MDGPSPAADRGHRRLAWSLVVICACAAVVEGIGWASVHRRAAAHARAAAELRAGQRAHELPWRDLSSRLCSREDRDTLVVTAERIHVAAEQRVHTFAREHDLDPAVERMLAGYVSEYVQGLLDDALHRRQDIRAADGAESDRARWLHEQSGIVARMLIGAELGAELAAELEDGWREWRGWLASPAGGVDEPTAPDRGRAGPRST